MDGSVILKSSAFIFYCIIAFALLQFLREKNVSKWVLYCKSFRKVLLYKRKNGNIRYLL